MPESHKFTKEIVLQVHTMYRYVCSMLYTNVVGGNEIHSESIFSHDFKYKP